MNGNQEENIMPRLLEHNQEIIRIERHKTNCNGIEVSFTVLGVSSCLPAK